MWLIILVTVGAFAGAADSPTDVRQPVPPITFGPWRRVSLPDDPPEYAMSFPSAVVTRHAANNTVPLAAFLPADAPKPVPVVMILHYWGARDLRVERSFARELAGRGLGAVIVTLPYHLQRTPPGSVSGALAIQPDPDQLVATMTQSVFDVRRAIDWITTRPEFDRSRVGIVGISLGAIVASLCYGVEPRLTRACFMLGGADLAHILWNSSIVVSQRDAMRRKGLTEDKLREALASIEPLNVLQSDRPNTAFVIGARYDTVVPAIDTQRLIDALPGARSLWLDTGHYGGIFVQRRLVRLASQFFVAEFGGQTFVPPKSIYAPTIRIGAEATPEHGFQIAVSLDLWTWGKHGDTFGALGVSSQGAHLFVGHKIWAGFAPGVFVGTDRASFGFFWSTVL